MIIIKRLSEKSGEPLLYVTRGPQAVVRRLGVLEVRGPQAVVRRLGVFFCVKDE